MSTDYDRERDLIVVDVEATGLDRDVHVPLEIAAVNFRTGETLEFVPHIAPEHLGQAEGQAMAVNRYYERGTYKMVLTPGETLIKYELLWDMLRGNVLGGANTRYDADMIRRGYAVASNCHRPADEVWHYRLGDVQNYAAGALGYPVWHVPSLHEVVKRLGIEHHNPHSALGDAEAAVECYRRLYHAASNTQHPF